jgi:2-dehydropantoate 2-reductase
MKAEAIMKIAVVGMGGIGSTFAAQLARAGHDVTAIARGKRLAQLQEHGGVLTAQGPVVPLTISGALDRTVPWDLVLVSVLAHQVQPLLPTLAASAAKQIMFMFNTFEPLQPLRDAVGSERFAFGFPSILARVDAQGRLESSIQRHGLRTTVTERALADVFSAAGIPSVVSTQMESWLRSHAAAVVPMMLASTVATQRRRGITWREAMDVAAVMTETFALVRTLGFAVVPSAHSAIDRFPPAAKAALLWSVTRNATVRASGAAGIAEARQLSEAMLAAAISGMPQLERLRLAAGV